LNFFLAEHAGFCFGVKRALNLLDEALTTGDKPADIYTYGPIIHNPQVIEKYKKLGIKIADDVSSVPKGKTIIFRSHGVGKDVLTRAKKRGLKIIDATCPYVKKVQKKAEELYNQGFQVVIIGDPTHPEVIGINGWCNNKGIIINDVSDLKKLIFFDKIGIVAQTTFPEHKFKEIVEKLKEKANDMIVFNTICKATQKRQQATRTLADEVDLFIVIGGFNSSNTRKLKQLCIETGIPTYQVEQPADLKPEWFKDKKNVGITAGASTPDWIIKEVVKAMVDFSFEKNIKDINEETTETEEKEVDEVDLEGNPEDESTAGMEEKIEEKYEKTFVSLKRGDIIEGTVVQVNDNEVLVNVGYKSDGIIPLNELSTENVDVPSKIVKEGDTIPVYVLKIENREGNLILSRKRALIEKAWQFLKEAFKSESIITAHVVEEVKGGLLVNIKGLKGFVPASHVATHYVPDLSIYIGKEMRLKVIELDRHKNRIILSQKVVLEEEQEKKRQETWEKIQEGQVIKGVVNRITDFGVFVDIGGVDGLVHISELSWGRVEHPSEVVKEGDEIEVKVLKVDRERERISLGLKQVLPDPWEDVEEKYSVGQIIPGKVVKLVNFGAFVEVEPGIEGLVHISQISQEHIAKPEDVLEAGQEVEVKILDINPDEHKMSLSIKEAKGVKPSKEKREAKQDKKVEKADSGFTIGDVFGDLLNKAKQHKEK